MTEQEIVEMIERKRRIILSGRASHRRIKMLSEQIDNLNKMRGNYDRVSV